MPRGVSRYFDVPTAAGTDRYVDTFNDLWQWDPQSTFWTWIGGTHLAKDWGEYNETDGRRNMPASRSSTGLVYHAPTASLLLFGGSRVTGTFCI